MKKKSYHHHYLQESSLTGVDAQLLKRLLCYFKPFRLLLGIAIGFLIISKCIETIVPIFIGNTTQRILNAYQSSESPSTLLSNILHICFFITGLLVISYILDVCTMLIKNWVGQQALYTMRLEVFEHMQHLPMKFYDHSAVGALMTRTIHDIDQINQMFSESIVPIIGNSLLFMSMLIAIFWMDWQLALVALSVLPLVWWLTHRFRVYQRQCYEMVRAILSAMNSFVQEHFLGFSTIRNLDLQAKERKKFEEMNADQCTANLESIHNLGFFIAGIEFIQNFMLILIFVALIKLPMAQNGGFQAGTFFTFSLYALMFFRPLGDLADRYNLLQSAMASAEKIFEILDQKVEPENLLLEASPSVTPHEIENIVFDDVWFAYEQNNWILKGLNLSIAKGESIAIVGVTGVGKTTLINLLLRFYEIQKGTIKINQIDIRLIPLDALRKLFSVVLQDPVIFNGTLADNLTFYHPQITRNHLNDIANYINLSPLLDQFSEKFDHVIGQNGGSLSLGQMQLIAIARAVLHPHDMLIFDEATANIDSGTEKIIQIALEKILKDKTALVIAHRLSTIRDVSRIIVLHDGKVKESGTHEELIDAKGIYEKLYRLQFSTL